jgi:hypothetical protein
VPACELQEAPVGLTSLAVFLYASQKLRVAGVREGGRYVEYSLTAEL